jgi:hypothetical protein
MKGGLNGGIVKRCNCGVRKYLISFILNKDLLVLLLRYFVW